VGVWAKAAAGVGTMLCLFALTGAPVRADHRIVDLVSTGPAGPSTPFHPSIAVVAAEDGRHVFFLSDQQLVAEDADSCEVDEGVFEPCTDLYERFQGATHLVSTGPHASTLHSSVEHFDVSADGTKAVFTTPDPLVAEDRDLTLDVYQRHGEATTLVSTGPADSGIGIDAELGGISADGSTVFFQTRAQFVAEDQDNFCGDIYARTGSVTRLVSTGPNDAAAPVASYPACASFWIADRLDTQIARDGSHAFFQAYRSLVSEDMNGEVDDVYRRTGDSTTLISTPSSPGDVGATFSGASRDGSRVFFRAGVGQALYEFANGETARVVPNVRGDLVEMAALSEDARRVFLYTCVPLVAEDTDDECDYYVRENGSFELLSTGPVDEPGGLAEHETVLGLRITPDGSRAFFHTTRRLVPEDADGFVDVYERSGGVTRLLSGNSAGADADVFLRAIADHGSRVFFRTEAQLVPEDTDSAADVYERVAGTTRLIGPAQSPDAVFLDDLWPWVSEDGRWALLMTRNAFLPQDTDGDLDYYLAAANGLPACEAVHATPSRLWPGNRKLVRVSLDGATDPDGDSVTIEITSVTQDEPTGRSRDAVLSSAGDEVRLRAERDNKGDGRVYRVAFEASDGNGGSCSGTAKVSVPRKKHSAAVDSAPPSYDSLG
jgi:hypothetical protein